MKRKKLQVELEKADAEATSHWRIVVTGEAGPYLVPVFGSPIANLYERVNQQLEQAS